MWGWGDCSGKLGPLPTPLHGTQPRHAAHSHPFLPIAAAAADIRALMPAPGRNPWQHRATSDMEPAQPGLRTLGQNWAGSYCYLLLPAPQAEVAHSRSQPGPS